MDISALSIFHVSLADDIDTNKTVSISVAQEIFDFFKSASLFRWNDANNDCEDRANAICILLDEWGIPNYKGWVFSGYFIKKNYGSLYNTWNYHVAAVLPVMENGTTGFYVVDPATSGCLITIEKWASQITSGDASYHFIKNSNYYIFPSGNIQKDNWHKRDKRNYRWTMQGLSGINGASIKGKAQLCFQKSRIKKAEFAFQKLKNEKPPGIIQLSTLS